MEVNAVHLGGSRGLRDVSFMPLEESADVIALERLDEPPARLGVRHAGVNRDETRSRVFRGRMEHLL